MKRRVTKAVKSLLRSFGLEIRRTKWAAAPASAGPGPRATLAGFLAHAVSLGLRPETVFDIGVADGTPELYAAFPEAKHVLVEPLAECLPRIREATAGLRRVEIVNAAAGCEPGTRILHVHPDLHGSSFFLEDEGAQVNGEPRSVPVVTLDALMEQFRIDGPVVMKLDVQGAELDALRGGRKALPQTECIIMEVCLYEFYRGGAQVPEVISFMEAAGFALYEVFAPLYRPLDGAMSQFDAAFVKKDGVFREHHIYATPDQRAQQHPGFRESLEDASQGGGANE